jgi:Na+/proline symporter
VSAATLGVTVLVLYLGVLFAIGAAAHRARRDDTPADHFLASRGLGLPVLFLTLYATAYSGNSLLGYPGEAYRRGFAFVMATGFMMAIVVVFHALVPRLRPLAVAHGFVTPGDWIRHRFGAEPGGTALRLGVALLMTVALGNFLLAQLVAMGHVAHQVTDGVVPYWAGVVGLAAVVLFYETVGGMRAVAWTDAAQGVLMLVGLLALLGWVLGDQGGLAATTRAVAALRPAAVAVPGPRECANWVSSIALLGLASVVYPQAIQRIYAARSATVLRRALAMMTFMPFATTLVVTLAGIAAIPRLEHLGGVEADTVVPRLLADWAATGPAFAVLAALVLLGALAAIMSTADSVLLSFGSVVAEDVFDWPREDPRTTQFGRRIAAGAMAALALLALSPQLTLWRLIELKMELLIQCVPAFLGAIHWRMVRARAACAGLVAGSALAAGAVLAGVPRLGGIHVGVLGLGVNLLVAVLGSLGEGARASSRE